MFLGHFAVGLAAKRLAPRTSLGVLFAAPQLLDLLWPIFVIAGWEEVRIDPGNTAFTPLDFVSYPLSHSLLMSAVWAILLGSIYWVVTRYRRGAVVAGVLVFSHWVLDLVTHRPDLPLYPGNSPRVGLGLWNSVAATIAVESIMFVAGVWIYVATTRARDRVGRGGFWALIVFLALIGVMNVTGPPPSSVETLKVMMLILWLFPFWAWWVDRHRERREAAVGSLA